MMDITVDQSREREEAPVCLACHQEIEGRHVLTWGSDHFCTRCGSQLVTVGIAKYTIGAANEKR